MINSTVVQTQTWLTAFFRACKEKPESNPFTLQYELLCAPIMKHFPKASPEQFQFDLLTYGLFDPLEWMEIEKQMENMENLCIWKIVEQEYQLLQSLWKGPAVSIYIFPITNVHQVNEQAYDKNGVAYKESLFLFLSDGLLTEEIKALFAHEYNHICRFTHLGLELNKISLKDSLIIEGLGEFAVKELYGEKWLAPWLELYSFREALQVWHTHFVPQLNLQGPANHHPFLYGKTNSHLPQWIGYYIGFHIVDSFHKKHGPFTNCEIYMKSADELITGSDFPVNSAL